MAHRQAFANYLQSIGFPEDLRNALFGQGLDNVNDLLGMTDSDIEDLCNNIRKPGGLILNDYHAINPDLPEYVPNPGTAVGRIYQERLKQLAYFHSYLVLVNRTFTANNANVNELVRLWKHKKNIESIVKNKKENDDDYPEKFSNSKPVREIIESMQNWIGAHYGIENIPLAYIIREDPDVPRVQDDPLPLGNPTYNDELIRRASHAGEAWVANNSRVWQMIRHVTHGTDAWAFVKGFSRAQDGRGAFYAMKSHYMGADFVNKVKLTADASLETLHWNGKARNFTWEKFISRLTSAFADLAENGEPKTDGEKVRRLLRAITDPTLNVAKAVVQGDQRYAENFEAATAYLAGQLSAAESISAGKRNISEISTERPGRGRGRMGGRGPGNRGGGRFGNRNAGRGRFQGRGRGRMGGGRYSQSGHLLTNGGYPAAVWETFTGAEKSQIYQMRETREESEKRKAAAVITTQNTTTPEPKRAREEETPERGIGAVMTRRTS